MKKKQKESRGLGIESGCAGQRRRHAKGAQNGLNNTTHLIISNVHRLDIILSAGFDENVRSLVFLHVAPECAVDVATFAKTDREPFVQFTDILIQNRAYFIRQ